MNKIQDSGRLSHISESKGNADPLERVGCALADSGTSRRFAACYDLMSDGS